MYKKLWEIFNFKPMRNKKSNTILPLLQTKNNARMKKNMFFSLAMVAITFASCDNKPKTPQTPPAVSVAVYKVQTGNATYNDAYPGTITAINQVDIRPQVTGYITGIFFQDGQFVHKGQKLYAIDQQQYKGAYEQAIANLNVAKADLAKAQQDADRYNELAKQDAIAKQTLDHSLADLESAKMKVAAAKANVSSVQTNLRYSDIYAPFDGIVGISSVKLGAAVSPGQTLLNTISSVDPIAVDFAVNETLIPRLNQLLQNKTSDKDSTFTIVLADGSVYPFPGHLALIDRAADPLTGTIKARLFFSNTKNMLRAGANCNVRIKNMAIDKLLIPYKAVVEQLGENFVFVVKNNKAIQHKVTLGNKIDDKIVVNSGLQIGDEIVTEGVQKLRDSTAVQIGSLKAK
jgi:membrane fusion protein (multidrug efflux system)